jgi:hypothetical protein
MWIRTSLILASLCGTMAAVAQQSSDFANLGWLAGCWELRRGNRVTLEMWMPPAGNLMLGGSRTVANGVVREFEQVRLAWQDGQLVYTARPSGQEEASFTGTLGGSDTGFAVSNTQHDFPQRIIYRRRGADSLVARIEGPGPNGLRGFDFPMRRVSCTHVSD